MPIRLNWQAPAHTWRYRGMQPAAPHERSQEGRPRSHGSELVKGKNLLGFPEAETAACGGKEADAFGAREVGNTEYGIKRE